MIQKLLAGLIQTGPNTWTDAGDAARRGLPRYVLSAPSVKTVAPTPKPRAAAVKTKAPSKPPARSNPRDIPDAMRRGRSNREIEALIARGVVHRPRSFVHASAAAWPIGAWQEAQRRGLVW